MMLYTCRECGEYVPCEKIETKPYKGKRKIIRICKDCYKKLCVGGKHD